MRYVIVLALMLTFIGCASGPPKESQYSWEFYSAPKVTPETFKDQSVAILPTVSIEYDPVQEVYRETLSGLLYNALMKYPGGPKIVPLDAVQSVINRNDLWRDVMLMYSEYTDSSVLRKDILSKLGQALAARYVLLPKLLRFQSETFDRATIIGIAFLRTRQSSVDIHAQLWDTETGEVLWEGASEGTVASEVVRGRPARFKAVAENS
jgi:TolB-like protein